MLGAGRIPETMTKTGVRDVDEVGVVRSLGLERVRLPEMEIKKVLQPPRLLVETHSNIEYEVSR
jgi:hypothetical protein